MEWYFQSVHYINKYLGVFLNDLQKDGILDNTVVMLYGDHEEIHKYKKQKLSLTSTNPCKGLITPCICIPLIAIAE